MPQDHRDGANKVGLLERSPGQQSYAAAGAQDTVGFPERTGDVIEEHDAEAAGDQVETVVREWQVMRVCLLKYDVVQRPLLSAPARHFQQFRVDVNADHPAAGAGLRGQANGGLARPARQVEHLHARLGSGELHNRAGDIATHGSRLAPPLLRGGHAESGAPGGGAGFGIHDNDFTQARTPELCSDLNCRLRTDSTPDFSWHGRAATCDNPPKSVPLTFLLR